MSKKLTVGKILGIIFCIIAAAGTVVLLCINVYFGGQMKLIDKYLTAIERNDFEGYKACFSEDISDNLTEENFLNAKKIVWAFELTDSNEFKIKADFKKRMPVENDEYKVIFNLTVYDDIHNETAHFVERSLIRQSGKWVFSTAEALLPVTEIYNNNTDDILRIVYFGTGSMGSSASYSLSDENVLFECNEILGSVFSDAENGGGVGSIYFGWDFKPVSSGECTLIVDMRGGGMLSYSDIYNVAVDENMKITYEVKRASRFTFMEHYFREKSSTGTVTVTADGTDITFEGEKAEKFRNCLKNLYGAYEKCEPPDIDKLKTVTIDYTSYDNSVQEKFYIGSDRLYYFLGEGNIQWYEFVPDKAVMLDGINELLNSKD